MYLKCLWPWLLSNVRLLGILKQALEPHFNFHRRRQCYDLMFIKMTSPKSITTCKILSVLEIRTPSQFSLKRHLNGLREKGVFKMYLISTPKWYKTFEHIERIFFKLMSLLYYLFIYYMSNKYLCNLIRIHIIYIYTNKYILWSTKHYFTYFINRNIYLFYVRTSFLSLHYIYRFHLTQKYRVTFILIKVVVTCSHIF